MKKSQKILTLLRSSATKSIKEIDAELDKESPSLETIRINFKVLETNENQLRDVNSLIMNLTLEDETITPHDLEKEQDMVVQYETNFIRTELRVVEYLQLKENEHQGRSNLDPTRSAQEENYPKVVKALQDRFEDKVILTEVYVRQLLKLVINNARKKTLTLESLYDQVESHLRALESLGVTTQPNASFLYPLVESSLPKDMLSIWQRSALAGYSEDEGELPISIDQRLQRLLEFLRREVKGEQRLEYMREGFGESSQRKNYGQHVARMHTAQIKNAQGRVTPLCLSCKGRHWIQDCASWRSMTVTKRMDEIRKVNSCFRCLRVGHMRATCRTQIRCSHCRGPHHTALHLPRQVSIENRDHGERESRNTEEPRASNGEQEVALSGMHVRTAIPKALLATARVRIVGPQGVGITVRALLDQGSQSSFVHQYLLHHLTVPVQKVNAQIYGVNDTRGEHVKQMVSCVSGGRMTGILPSRDLRIPVPSSWKTLSLADPQFETSGRVDVILVADVYGSLLLPEFKYDEKTQLCAQKTRLGWIISGKLLSEGKGSSHMVYNIRVNYEEKLDNILRRFWEVEEVPIRPAKSGEDKFCEELYKTKVQRTASGRYIVPLPFDPKVPIPELFGGSVSICVQRQLSLERRLAKQVPLKEEYHSFMRENIKLGHMTPLPALVAEDSPGGCFIPHHAVWGNRRKLRVVFDASTVTSNGFSFNNRVYTGPKLQRDIFTILMNWRYHKVVMLADIEKMYRQVLVCPTDAARQKILWRETSNEPMKWASNDPTILNQIHEDARLKKIQFDGEEVVKTLGLGWDPAGDYFLYSFQEPTQGDEITKRGMLSLVAKLYDPMGWLAPVIVIGKIMIQRLWVAGKDWDAPIDGPIKEQWKKFREQLGCLRTVRIPRWLSLMGIQDIQLHGFSDASEDAYAAAVYIRISGSEGIRAELVAPRRTDATIVLAWIKTIARTLPTFVGNRVSEIQTSRQIQEWRHVPSGENPADLASRGVLGSMIGSSRLWWKGPSWLILSRDQWPKMPTISGRSEIRTALSVGLVNQVPFLVALGERFSSITTYNRVVAWILRFISNCRGGKVQSPLNPAEIKRAYVEILLTDEQGVLRVGGRLRWAPGIPYHQKYPALLLSEGRLSQLIIRDRHQRTLHGGTQLVLSILRQEYWILRDKDQIKKCVRDCVICCGERSFPTLYTHSRGEWSGEASLRVCLAPEYHWLILSEAVSWWSALAMGMPSHAGLWTERSGWPLLQRCVICCRYNRTTQHQVMSDLPKERLTPGKPFTVSGVDYAGPIQLKLSGGRGRKVGKGYICLFVCFVTRAVHMELVTDASTPTFLAAFKRFVARRGRCNKIYSGQGTNFVGAAKKLKSDFYLSRQQLKELTAILANDGTEWQFYPPGAPHFGGLWEAGIRCLKHHLRRIVGTTVLTYEKMLTVLIQIESCLNSRPLAPLGNDSNDLEALTPAHFLVTSTSQCVPEEDLQQRNKWKIKEPNMLSGSLVLIKEGHVPPAKWLMGRVVEVHPGKDGVVRVVSLRTVAGVIKRPLVKLALLQGPPVSFDGAHQLGEDVQIDI
ncbi:hypothetical protein LAZ67_13000216 [Cordylochernes scorpioides]|uniref:Integrase catalytic domain-containing protein n=1 Tax=Cordylochernes scorpioides TaxID=51811 RepID=A0ABY6L2P3_9ARAC|nr:hypothetical protein LAZ67_13000216 [Cordylochernes scorpioides]